MQATQAGLVAGQAGGGALKQRQDQIVSAGAQMVGNQQYDLALKSIASKQEAVDKLISLGQTEKANELQNQQIEESRILTNNTILDNLRNYEVDNINRFNNLVLSMKLPMAVKNSFWRVLGDLKTMLAIRCPAEPRPPNQPA